MFNEAGEKLTPSYAIKQGVHYRYYISTSAMQSRERAVSVAHRLPAPTLEATVFEALRSAIESETPEAKGTDFEVCRAPGQHGEIGDENGRGLPPASMLFPEETSEARPMVDNHLVRVVVRSEKLDIEYRPDPTDAHAIETLSVSWSKPSPHVRRAILAPASHDDQSRRMHAEERDRLIPAIATARSWLDGLVNGSYLDLAELAATHKRTLRSVRMTLSLAFLDPALIDAACAGSLPRGYGVTRLMDLPPRFADQWRALGLQPPA